MKRLIALLLACIMVTGCIVSVQADEQMPVTVFVNGEQIIFDVDPIIENGRTLVPVRYIFEALGAKVDWIEETSTVVATKGDIEITLAIGSNEMTKNGEVIILDVPAKEINGRTLVPARAVSEGLDAKVDWVDELQQVIITTEAAVSAPVEKDEYNYNELSAKDANILFNTYTDVRYEFEQSGLVSMLYESDTKVAKDITDNNAYTLDAIKDLWNSYFVSLAVQAQIGSEDTYIFDGSETLTEDELYQTYIDLITSLKLSSENFFDITFEKTPGGKDVCLITFKNTDTMLACKYIGIASVDGSIRYFTAESDFMTETQYFFCEVTPEGRGSFFTVNQSASEFLAGIDNVINNNLAPASSTTWDDNMIEMNH